MQRIGVFVCHCGSNIAATVDVKKVVELAKLEPGVVHAEDYQYMCSEAGQAKIGAAIAESFSLRFPQQISKLMVRLVEHKLCSVTKEWKSGDLVCKSTSQPNWVYRRVEVKGRESG